MPDFSAWSITDWTTAVLALLGAFSVIAKMTPTDADDKIVRLLINVIHGFGLTKKGPK